MILYTKIDASHVSEIVAEFAPKKITQKQGVVTVRFCREQDARSAIDLLQVRGYSVGFAASAVEISVEAL